MGGIRRGEDRGEEGMGEAADRVRHNNNSFYYYDFLLNFFLVYLSGLSFALLRGILCFLKRWFRCSFVEILVSKVLLRQ